MLRKFGFSVAIVSALLAAKVNALGMGEIRVKSALNEPLHAEIALFQIKNLSPLQIKSRMADLNDFALSGLATQRALSNVRFQVRVRSNGTGRIILTSKLPVTEPFMNFLVEVNWPSGRLIREYTLLLDPPSYQSSLNGRPFVATANAITKPIAKPRPKPKKVAAKRVPAGVVVGPGQYYITPQDTLWDIAIANRPNKRVTPQQMMVLMQQKNPLAFPNGNINVMRARQVIDLPTKEDLDSLSTKDAQTEVARQTNLWKSGKLPKISPIADKAASSKADSAAKVAKKGAADTAKSMAKDADKLSGDKSEKDQIKSVTDEPKMADKDAVKDAAPGEPVTSEKGMINVVTPEEAQARLELQAKAEAMALAASKDSDKIAQLLQNNAELDVKLALSQESIDKLERDNTELNKKLDTIVKQLEDINRLILLKDEQLAAMQDERQESEKDQQDKAKQESDKSWLDKLLDNTLGLITAGVGWLLAIIAGVFLLLRRKKKDPDDELAPVEDKSEPTISLPDEMMDDDVEELEADEGSEIDRDLDVDVDELDLDLDLDLDMDMDLDESFDPEALEGADDSADNSDLAAELEAQLNTVDEDPEDDDLDMLDGIDSLEFDLGEVDEDEDIDLEIDAEPELDEEAAALAEFARAMEEDAPSEDDAPPAADNELPENEDTGDFPEEDELEIEMPDIEASTVEEEEMDIADIDEPVASLEEMEQAEALENEQQPVEDGVDEDASVESLIESDLTADEDLEIELDEEPEELSLDSGAMDAEEEEEQIPMDDALGDLLGLGVEPDADDDDGESQSDEVVAEDSADTETNAEADTKVLDEELDELLSSTDDDIALDAVAPEFDADNEEGIDLLSGEDGVRMKLDLARAYVEMGDDQGAQDIIDEVMTAGDEEQKREAQELLESLKSK